tara:strand:+ start:302 stop:412 length:111 start_codon:yes stop_codon:yes gene_type:complete
MEGLLYYTTNWWWIFAILGLVWFTDLVDYFFDKWGM